MTSELPDHKRAAFFIVRTVIIIAIKFSNFKSDIGDKSLEYALLEKIKADFKDTMIYDISVGCESIIQLEAFSYAGSLITRYS